MHCFKNVFAIYAQNPASNLTDTMLAALTLPHHQKRQWSVCLSVSCGKHSFLVVSYLNAHMILFCHEVSSFLLKVKNWEKWSETNKKILSTQGFRVLKTKQLKELVYLIRKRVGQLSHFAYWSSLQVKRSFLRNRSVTFWSNRTCFKFN